MIKSIEDVISQYNGEFNPLNYANGLVIKKILFLNYRAPLTMI